MKIFIDANVPMYVAGRDHPHRGPAAQFLTRVRRMEFDVCTSAEVLQEILYRYSAERRPELGARLYDEFVLLCPRILDITVADTDRARTLLLGVPNLSARDALHAAVMLNHGIHHIATFDRDFDRIPGIERIELS